MNTVPLTEGQKAVIRTLGTLGAVTDAALATYVHHMDRTAQSSSSVRSRRAELVRKGLVHAVDTVVLKSGRRAAVHDLTPAGVAALADITAETQAVV